VRRGERDMSDSVFRFFCEMDMVWAMAYSYSRNNLILVEEILADVGSFSVGFGSSRWICVTACLCSGKDRYGTRRMARIMWKPLLVRIRLSQ